ncbi:hypothetical protein SDC9_83488 [bioreactor metagenome]|uniref:Type II secretion system protein GspC N-terminal domain-containing protein n=1 Tax=bioreactor metagenome TaxID=1076179 RepID=A0A644ZGA5_9ZZZZ
MAVLRSGVSAAVHCRNIGKGADRNRNPADRAGKTPDGEPATAERIAAAGTNARLGPVSAAGEGPVRAGGAHGTGRRRKRHGVSFDERRADGPGCERSRIVSADCFVRLYNHRIGSAAEERDRRQAPALLEIAAASSVIAGNAGTASVGRAACRSEFSSGEGRGMNARNGIIVGSFLLAAALLLSVASLLRRGADVPVVPELPEPVEEPAASRPQEKAIPAELEAGNLFHPLRGAPPPEEKAEAAAPERNRPAGNFMLTGIFSFGEERGAVITSGVSAGEKPGSALRRVFRTGAEVGGGYLLSEIQADRAVLVRGGEKIILHLYKTQEPKMRERKP